MNAADPALDKHRFFENFRDNLPEIFERPPADADLLGAVQFMIDQCLPGLLGLKMLKLEREECVAEIEYRKETTGLHGLMHGGTIFSAGDTLTAMMSMLYGDETSRNVLTTDASIRYLRPVAAGKIKVVSKLTRREGPKLFFQCDYFNEDGKRVSRSRYTYIMITAEAE